MSVKNLMWANLGLSVATNLQLIGLSNQLKNQAQQQQDQQQQQNSLVSTLLENKRILEKAATLLDEDPITPLAAVGYYRTWVLSGANISSFGSVRGKQHFLECENLAEDIEIRSRSLLTPEAQEEVYLGSIAAMALQNVNQQNAAAAALDYFKKSNPKRIIFILRRIAVVILGAAVGEFLGAPGWGLFTGFIGIGAYEVISMRKAHSMAGKYLAIVGIKLSSIPWLRVGAFWKVVTASMIEMRDQAEIKLRSVIESDLRNQPIEVIIETIKTRANAYRAKYPDLVQ